MVRTHSSMKWAFARIRNGEDCDVDQIFICSIQKCGSHLYALCASLHSVDRYLLSGIVNAVSLESTTKIASKLAGSIALAFSLTV